MPSGTTTTELRKEQEKRKALEAQVNELKTTVFKSDNQKVISLATKVSFFFLRLLRLHFQILDRTAERSASDGE